MPQRAAEAGACTRARAALHVLAIGVVVSVCAFAAPKDPFTLDRDGARWVEQTLKRLTLDEKIGQVVVASFDSTYVGADSKIFDELVTLTRDYHVGGFHVFGGKEPAPSVLLNPAYGTVILGQAHVAAAMLNRLQAIASVPLLNTADFEAGVGFRIAGATTFPRQMALGATGADAERLVREAARITAIESRALGVHVDFAPLADVNNNARNPVINMRSYGENPQRVGALVAAYIDGAHQGGALATVKHFPGHGDTDVDSHLGLPMVGVDRARLDRIELPPFRAGIDRGADAVMAAHIVLPALDPAPQSPATFSRSILDGLLRRDLGFQGLIYTDSLLMEAITKMASPGDAAVRAFLAGADLLLDSPDPIAAVDGLKAAAADGRLASARLDASVERVLRAKASLGLQKERLVDLNAVLDRVGGRAHAAVAQEAAAGSITLIKDARNSVPLTVPRDAPVLYLSVLDYPSGWRIASPSRTFIPELKKRWPQVTSIELSDRTAPADLDMVRAIAPRYAAIVASVFIRASSASGRMDLAPELARLLRDLAGTTERSATPLVTIFFGNPYIPSFVPELPTMLLTYDIYDLPERAAVAAIAGEAPIHGRLPIALPGLFPVGHGLDRNEVGSR
jgi:beta-glucosidase-like glycosyl hydrolase